MDQSITLKDGLSFGHAEWGDPSGEPTLLFVGGSSRLVHPIVETPGIRLITVDRPGIGLSDYRPRRTLLDLPEDILQLLDYLEIEKIGVVGISQGGPSALACAYKIPHRVVAVSVVSSLAPLTSSEYERIAPGSVRDFSKLANDYPWAVHLQHAVGSWMARISPKWTFQQVLKSLPEADRSIFMANAELVNMFIDDIKETYRQGGRGPAREGLLVYRPWGFRLEDIRIKTYVWHGEEDQSVPIAIGHQLAKSLPNCVSRFLPDEGHFLGLKCWREISTQLYSI